MTLLIGLFLLYEGKYGLYNTTINDLEYWSDGFHSKFPAHKFYDHFDRI